MIKKLLNNKIWNQRNQSPPVTESWAQGGNTWFSCYLLTCFDFIKSRQKDNLNNFFIVQMIRRWFLKWKQTLGGVLWKKYSLKFRKFTGKHLCQSLLFNKIEDVNLVQVFCCEFWEIFQKIFFCKTRTVVASAGTFSNDEILKTTSHLWDQFQN